MSSPYYAPSEAAIEDAIQRRIGSAGFFQRVAEQLARGIYVDLSVGLVPFGRRADDKTVAGWPDAYLLKQDGAVIAIEATTSNAARTGHWQEDLAKLESNLAPGRRGGLVWVAWCDPSLPTDAADMRDQAGRLGLPSDDTHIIFRKDICARLRSPFHARFWINDLDLRVTSEPFRSIKDVIEQANMRRSPGIFPTSEEFEEGRVYIPPVLAEVERTLVEQRAVVVVGHGAAGKTTLAMLLSLRPHRRHAPTYYIDLTVSAGDPTLVERAGKALAAVADPGVLFVIDNAHLDAGATVRLLAQWEAFGRGSNLLILTRRIRAKAKVWEDEPELESIKLPCVDLTIDSADLEGVFRRLYFAQFRHEPPPVRPEVLGQWYGLFGGDLLAFSAAVLGLLERGGEAAALEPADAGAFVRNRYIADPELVSEQSALLDLAAVAEVEGLVPVEAFAEDALENCVRRGLVWVETRGFKGAYRLYRLVHPGLGTLLREAAGRAATSRFDRCRMLGGRPFACVATALRLEKGGANAEAQALFAALWREAEWPLSAVGLHWWRASLRATQDLGVLDTEEMLTRVRSWLLQSETGAVLMSQALVTPLGDLASFLVFARTEMPEVAKAVREGLARNPAELVKRALATPLHFLPSFLDFARTEVPEVAKAVREGLARNSDELAKRALATPLGDLASFLIFARTEMPEVAKAVREGLARNPDELAKRALATPLEHLASFLAYARKEMPEVGSALTSAIVSKRLSPMLANQYILGGPEKIAALCREDDRFVELLIVIDATEWAKRWSESHLGQPTWFASFASLCYRVDRADLVGPIGKAIIRHTHAEDFPSPTITLRHLTFILTSQHGCAPEEVDSFLSRRLGPDWLAAHYRSKDATIGALAGAVRSIALDEQKWLGGLFRHPALLQRVRAEQPTSSHSPRHLAEWLQLFGAVRLLDRSLTHGQSACTLQLSEALKVLPPGQPDQGIRSMQAGLWGGLREWCHVSAERPIVNADLAEGILAQFRAAAPAGRPRLAAFNAIMIDWLERCQRNEWRLVVDHESLLDALESRLGVQDAGPCA